MMLYLLKTFTFQNSKLALFLSVLSKFQTVLTFGSIWT